MRARAGWRAESNWSLAVQVAQVPLPRDADVQERRPGQTAERGVQDRDAGAVTHHGALEAADAWDAYGRIDRKATRGWGLCPARLPQVIAGT